MPKMFNKSLAAFMMTAAAQQARAQSCDEGDLLGPEIAEREGTEGAQFALLLMVIAFVGAGMTWVLCTQIIEWVQERRAGPGLPSVPVREGDLRTPAEIELGDVAKDRLSAQEKGKHPVPTLKREIQKSMGEGAGDEADQTDDEPKPVRGASLVPGAC